MSRWIAERDVTEQGSFHRSTLRRLIEKEGFPAAHKFSARCKRWKQEDVDAWFESRETTACELSGNLKCYATLNGEEKKLYQNAKKKEKPATADNGDGLKQISESDNGQTDHSTTVESG